MRSFFKRLDRDTRGTTAIEFAIIAPIFIIMLIGTLVLGHAFYTMSTVQWALEETTRELMIDKDMTTEAFEVRAKRLLQQLSHISIDIAYAQTTYGEIPVTEVTSTVTYPVNIPLYGAFDLSYTVETHAPRPL